MPVRKVVEIDEEKCDGCGQCVPSCAEGAIQVIGGKARLVSDVYCDGLGACLGHCPRGAISVTEREAAPFDEAAAHAHVAVSRPAAHPARPAPRPAAQHHAGHACPGAAMRAMAARPSPAAEATDATSALANWPVQLHLLSPHAPYFEGANLLIAADCVPFAYAGFHSKLLAGRVVGIGCPKLDDGQAYGQKLTAILGGNEIKSVTVAFMEVPCCFGLVQLVRQAMQESGCEAPLRLVKIGIGGEAGA